MVQTKYNFSVESTNLNQFIPVACQTLNMSYEPLISVDNIGKYTVDAYMITLT